MPGQEPSREQREDLWKEPGEGKRPEEERREDPRKEPKSGLLPERPEEAAAQPREESSARARGEAQGAESAARAEAEGGGAPASPQRQPPPEMLELARLAVQRGMPLSEVERCSSAAELRRRLAELEDRDTLFLAVAEDLKQAGGLRAAGYVLERPPGERTNDVAALRNAWVGEVLRWASQELHGERDIVMAAVRQKAKHQTSGARSFVLAAVAKDLSVLNFAEQQLGAGELDQGVVLAMVAQSGEALDWASRALGQEREVVLAAVGRQGCALEWTSQELMGEICLTAVTQSGEVLGRASRELWAAA